MKGDPRSLDYSSYAHMKKKVVLVVGYVYPFCLSRARLLGKSLGYRLRPERTTKGGFK